MAKLPQEVALRKKQAKALKKMMRPALLEKRNRVAARRAFIFMRINEK